MQCNVSSSAKKLQLYELTSCDLLYFATSVSGFAITFLPFSLRYILQQFKTQLCLEREFALWKSLCANSPTVENLTFSNFDREIRFQVAKLLWMSLQQRAFEKQENNEL